MRDFFRAVLAIVLAVCVMPASPSAAARPIEPGYPFQKLSAALAEALNMAAPNEQLPILVRFVARADLPRALAGAEGASRAARGPRVVAALQAAAEAAQAAPRVALAKAESDGRASRLRWFWISNAVALRATPGVIAELATRPDVRSVARDEARQYLRDAPAPGADALANVMTRAAAISANAVYDPPGATGSTWGIAKIRAGLVRHGLGVDGAGIVVANIDSGVEWTHPALMTRYRGYGNGLVFDHLHNWIDATDGGAVYPLDGHGHGTHTMGTMVGGEGIGVAPGARWMAARGLNSAGLGFDTWLIAAMEFILAPGGDAGYAPDIVNNSWGNTDGGSALFAEEIAALQSAGILVIFSAGNSGPGAGTVGSPGSNPGVPAIGASDEDDDIAYFSSRGPSVWDETKPLVSAPGVGVVSAAPGGVYKKYSGTSMGAPHVAGAAALLLSANPGLSGPAALEVLTRTAVPLSTTLPNNVSGWGRIDAFAAALAILGTGLLSGTVVDGGVPISGALATAHGDTGSGLVQSSAWTDSSGRYYLPGPAGLYTVSVAAFGFGPAESGPRMLLARSTVIVDFDLGPDASGLARGSVVDAVSGAYITATVRALGTPRSSLSNLGCAPCRYGLELPAGVYTLEARALGYFVQTRTVAIADGGLSTADFALTPTLRLALVDSGAFYYGSAISQYREALAALGHAWDEIIVKQVPRDTPTITQLLGYDAVVWSAPYDSPGIIGAGAALSGYLGTGRRLILSGQDIGYYDSGWFGIEPYFRLLNVVWEGDDASTQRIAGEPGTAWAGSAYTIAGGTGANNQFTPDQFRISDGDFSTVLARYVAPALSNSDPAGVFTGQCLNYRLAYFGFGLEAIDTAAGRAQALGRSLDLLAAPSPTLGVGLAAQDTLPTGDAVDAPGAVIIRPFRVRHTGEAGITQTFHLTVSDNFWPTELSAATVRLAPCQTVLVTATIRIPVTVTGRATDLARITAVAEDAPTATATLDYLTHTPAGVLLIDDDRWYDREVAYMEALRAAGIGFDVWSTLWRRSVTAQTPVPRPSAQVLSRYRMVMWFNGYDWFDPITPGEEQTMAAYLDGGGRLFYTSQAALYYTGINDFSQRYLGVAGVLFDDAISRTVAEPGNPVGLRAFSDGSLLPWPTGYNWNLSSALVPMSATHVIARGQSGQPAALAREGRSGPEAAPWRTIFMPYPFEAYAQTARQMLVDQIAGWLSPLGATSLEGGREVVGTGDETPMTLTLQADDVFGPAGTLTRAVQISVTLEGGLAMLTTTLTGAGAAYGGAWAGEIAAGAVISLTFAVQAPALAEPGAALTVTAHIALPEIGLRFTRKWPLRMAAPQMTVTLDLAPGRPRPGESINWAVRVANIGTVTASGSMTTAVPFGLRLLTSTLMVDGPGIVAAGPPGANAPRVAWRGTLAPGEAATVTFAARMDFWVRDLGGNVVPWLATARADDGLGGWWGASAWLWPMPRPYFLPRVGRT
ncbi:MAG: S8 family serine peptidase [Thermoflexales bacterium]